MLGYSAIHSLHQAILVSQFEWVSLTSELPLWVTLEYFKESNSDGFSFKVQIIVSSYEYISKIFLVQSMKSLLVDISINPGTGIYPGGQICAISTGNPSDFPRRGRQNSSIVQSPSVDLILVRFFTSCRTSGRSLNLFEFVFVIYKINIVFLHLRCVVQIN